MQTPTPRNDCSRRLRRALSLRRGQARLRRLLRSTHRCKKTWRSSGRKSAIASPPWSAGGRRSSERWSWRTRWRLCASRTLIFSQKWSDYALKLSHSSRLWWGTSRPAARYSPWIPTRLCNNSLTSWRKNNHRPIPSHNTWVCLRVSFVTLSFVSGFPFLNIPSVRSTCSAPPSFFFVCFHILNTNYLDHTNLSVSSFHSFFSFLKFLSTLHKLSSLFEAYHNDSCCVTRQCVLSPSPSQKTGFFPPLSVLAFSRALHLNCGKIYSKKWTFMCWLTNNPHNGVRMARLPAAQGCKGQRSNCWGTNPCTYTHGQVWVCRDYNLGVSTKFSSFLSLFLFSFRIMIWQDCRKAKGNCLSKPRPWLS